MSDLLKKGFLLGLGTALTSKEKVENYIDDLVIKGQIAPSEAKELINDLIAKGEAKEVELDQEVKTKLNNLLSDLGFATNDDIQQLRQKMNDLEQKLDDMDQHPSTDHE